MKKILIIITLILTFFAYSCDSSPPAVGGTENPPTVDPDNPGTTDPETPSITITSGDGLYAPSDTVHLSYTLANGQVRWETDRSDLIAVDSNGIVSAKPRTAAIAIQPVIIQAQSNGAETGKITLYVGDYSYDESTKTYHIYSELGLNHWAGSDDVLTAKVTLERDITLTKPADENGSNWNGIGDLDNGYNATFDGQGHTISGLRMSQTDGSFQGFGFFRSIDSKAVIRNLNLTDVYIYSISEFIGAIAGSSSGRIENCTVSGTEVIGKNSRVGGIAGYSKGDILSCTNNCMVTAYDKDPTVGGIVGYAELCNITDCTNTGEIILKGYNGVKGGGIAGNIISVTVNKCTNSGNIIGTNYVPTEPPNYLCLGGIVGQEVSGSTITDCTVAEGVAISAYYYVDDIDCAEPSVGSICGNAIAGPTNTGTATITKINQSQNQNNT